MLKILHEYFDHALSYLTAGLALFMTLPLMQIGGGILLISRLIVDIPPAYIKLKELFKK